MRWLLSCVESHKIYMKLISVKAGVALLLLLTITACSTFSESTVHPTINQLVIKNVTRYDAKDVKVSVEKLKGLFNCNIILAKSHCSSGFKPRPYENNEIVLSWNMIGETHTVGPVDFGYPISQEERALMNQPLTAFIEILDRGEFRAYFAVSN